MINFRSSTSSAVMSRTIRVGSNALDHRSTSNTNAVLELWVVLFYWLSPSTSTNRARKWTISTDLETSWDIVAKRSRNECLLSPYPFQALRPCLHAHKVHSIAQSLLYDCIGLVTPHQTSWVEELDVRNREFYQECSIYCNPTKNCLEVPKLSWG